MAANEQEFNTEVVHSLRALGAWAHKFPDLPNAARRVVRFFPGTPFDISFIINSCGGAIESKFMKKWGAFGNASNGTTDKQMANLEKVSAAGGISYVFLGIQEDHCLIVFKWPNQRLVDRDSYKKKELMELGRIPLEQGRGGVDVYDLSFIFRDAEKAIRGL